MKDPNTAPAAPRPVLFAPSPLGVDLPVIDVTNPAFALNQAAIECKREQMRQYADQMKKTPAFVSRAFVWFAAHRSRLFRAFRNPEKGFLGGLHTYVMKLGADNLVPPYATGLDRYLADMAPVVSMRLRLQQVAELTAEGLIPLLAAEPDRPVFMFNIGGGPALDSLNALIICRKAAPDLTARPFYLQVFDGDPEGPAFGQSCLDALSAENGPLADMRISLEHVPYDWRETAPLAQRVKALDRAGAILIASSEGALFEYGGDADILANLLALHAGGLGARFVTGSITRNDPFTRGSMRFGGFRLQTRGTEGATKLANEAGYQLDALREAFLSDQVRLAPRP